jgi:hypothetical protein
MCEDMTNIELLTVKVNCHHHAIAIATNIAGKGVRPHFSIFPLPGFAMGGIIGMC